MLICVCLCMPVCVYVYVRVYAVPPSPPLQSLNVTSMCFGLSGQHHLGPICPLSHRTACPALQQMRAMLGRFGLSGQHHLTPICKLSGGQKARVVFTAICLLQPHILLLDEPTNHLDMQVRDKVKAGRAHVRAQQQGYA